MSVWQRAVIVVSFLTTTIYAFESTAYCLNGRKWTDDVPVYVVTSGNLRIDRIGLRTDTAIRYIEAALQQWNEASGANLKLHYAGERSQHDHGDDGVTIYATHCGSNACGPNFVGCTWAGVPDVRIALYPANCSANQVTWTVTPPGTDVQSVVAHEIGHAIGFDHSNDTCSTSQNGATRGVMRSWTNETNGAHRWLRRDDIEGMRAKYGTRNRLIRYRTSSNGAVWGNESTIANSKARTPISSTDAVDSTDSGVHGLAWANEHDRVTHLTGYWSGWYSGGAGHVVDQTDNGRTWDPPAIARSQKHLMLAWLSDESSTSYNVRLRWAVRPLGRPDFKAEDPHRDGPVTFHKALGASYNRERDVFLLTYLDTNTQAHVITIDPASGNQINDTNLNMVFHEVGSPACEPTIHGECLVPVASSGVNGPCLGWLRGFIDASRRFALKGDRYYCYYSMSSSDLTLDQRIYSVPNDFSHSGLRGDKEQESYYWIEVLPGAAEMSIRMYGGSGDADLYVKYGSIPTTTSWDHRPYLPGNDETVTITSPKAGHWGLMVRAYNDFEGASLTSEMKPGPRHGFLGSFTQTRPTAYLYRMLDSFATPMNVSPIHTDYWPIGVGTMNNSSEVKYRAYYGR